MSSLTVQNIQGSASSSNTINVASGHKINGNVTHGTGSVFPAGHIVQVKEENLTTQFSTTSTSFTNVGLQLQITPTSSSNKILLLANFSLYINSAFIYVTINKNHSGIGDTNLEIQSSQGLCQLHAGGGNQGIPSSIGILDSPATTNEVTYNLKMKVQSGTGYFNINTSPAFFRGLEVVA